MQKSIPLKRLTPAAVRNEFQLDGAGLRQIRKSLGWTLAEFGDVIGLSGPFVSSMERGERPVERRTALAAHLMARRAAAFAAVKK